MKRFLLVLASCVAILVFTALHKSGGALFVGLVVGTPLFLSAFPSSGGIASVRISRDPGQKARKPTDPAGSMGMGLAAAGIAAAAMVDPNYPQEFRYFYIACYAAGMGIAVYAAARALKTSKATPLPAPKRVKPRADTPR